MTIVIFVAILAILIISHELGHFLIAKWSGSRVDEFGLGFPPRIWGYKKGETIYSINWIPFGGFVKIFGEDPTKDATTDERSLANKPALWQAAVLVAGVTFNLIFAWILFTVGFATVGLPVSTSELPVNYQASNFSVTIVGVLPESPASDAGIKMGDKIKALTVGANRVVAPKVAEVQALIKNSNKKSVVLEYERNNKMEVVSILPRELKTGLGIGVSLDEIGNLKLPLGSAMVAGARSTWSSLVFTAQSFG
ncbi:MAG: site-2 protease family protein, partial [Patescibacteria group bacterium]